MTRAMGVEQRQGYMFAMGTGALHDRATGASRMKGGLYEGIDQAFLPGARLAPSL